jgi:hypothetical protein
MGVVGLWAGGGQKGDSGYPVMVITTGSAVGSVGGGGSGLGDSRGLEMSVVAAGTVRPCEVIAIGVWTVGLGGGAGRGVYL